MGTRGCIAVGTIDRWEGIYNHMDSYPSGLGKEVWNKIRDIGLDAFVEEIRNNKDKSRVTSENPDPLFIEWVYIINPKTKSLSLLSHRYDDNFVGSEPTKNVKMEEDGWWNYGHCRCRHDLIIQLDINGKEPDWEALEKMRE